MLPDEVDQCAVQALLKRQVLSNGDYVLITRGDHAHAQGGTNTLRILRVGDA